MNGKDLLTGLGYIGETYYEEAETAQMAEAPRKRLLSRPLVIAALISLMVLLMGCAWVVMNLNYLTIRDTDSADPTETNIYGEEINVISLQGFMGTNSYAAFKEWHEFLDVYDPDNSILYNGDDFQRPEAYESYSCYSQEMVDKIEYICQKYDLQPLGRAWYFEHAEDIFNMVGIETVFAEDVQITHSQGYCYADGTFSLEGTLELGGKWDKDVSFDYRCVQKNSFDGVSRNIGNVDEYDQWNYVMQNGTQVLLALRENGGLIIVDKEDCFVTVGILGVFANGSPFGDLPTERAFLENFCELFDFSYNAQRMDPGKADALYQAQLEQEASEETKKFVGGQVDPAYRSSYANFIDYMIKEMKFEDLKYVLIDVDGNGVEELLLQCEHIARYDGDPSSFFDLHTIKDGEVFQIISASNLYLCQGGIIEDGYTNSHYYITLKEGRESVVYAFQEDKWYVQEDWTEGTPSREVTKEDAEAVIAQYPRIELEFRPVAEFPID